MDFRIVDHCIIRNKTISNSEGVVFKSEEDSLEGFLLATYDKCQFNYPKYFKMDNLSKLGFVASEVILSEAIGSDTSILNLMSIVLTTSHGSLASDLKFFESTAQIASPSLFVYTLANIVAGEIAIRYGIKGENMVLVSEKFDAKLLAENVEMSMLASHAEFCIAGWIDSLGEQHEVYLCLIGKAETTNENNSLYERLISIYNA